MHVLVALAALVTSATLRGHAETVARWMHEQRAHACVHTEGCRAPCIADAAANPHEGNKHMAPSERSSHACSVCMHVCRALAHVSEPSVHERLWHALLEASIQKLETRKPSSGALVDMVVSTGVGSTMWLKGTALVLPHAHLVKFWVKLLTGRGRRLPPAALLHSVMVRCES